jgi:hypothetical protein
VLVIMGRCFPCVTLSMPRWKAHQKELAGDKDVASDGACRSFNGFNDATLN